MRKSVSRLQAKPNLSFFFSTGTYSTLPNKYCKPKNAAITLTGVDLCNYNPHFLIYWVNTDLTFNNIQLPPSHSLFPSPTMHCSFMISPIFYSGLAFAFIKPLSTSRAVSHLPSPRLSPFALLSLLKPHSLQAQPSVNSCLRYLVYPVPWLSAIQAGCADKGRPLGLSVMGLFSGRRRFSWFADTGWRVRGREGRAFGGDLYCVCAWLRTFVHLAGSYQGLASPDDRYEGGGERDSGGKKKGTQGLLHQHN